MTNASAHRLDSRNAGRRRSETPRWLALLAVAVLVTFLVHEAAHWLVGTLLGSEMTYGMNGAVPTSAMTPRDHALMSAAGPVVTLCQALAALTVVLTRRSLAAYAFLFAAAFMRVVAQGLSFVLPNDEARVSEWLGIGFWTLPLIVSAGLIVCVVQASRSLHLTWRFNALAYLVASLSVSAIVGLDMIMRR